MTFDISYQFKVDRTKGVKGEQELSHKLGVVYLSMFNFFARQISAKEQPTLRLDNGYTHQ